MIGEPITYLSASTVIDRASGEEREDWANPQVALGAVAAVEPMHGGEDDATYRQANVIGYRLYHEGDVQVSRLWRARVRGEVLEVASRPALWRSPWTGRDGTVVETRFADG